MWGVRLHTTQGLDRLERIGNNFLGEMAGRSAPGLTAILELSTLNPQVVLRGINMFLESVNLERRNRG